MAWKAFSALPNYLGGKRRLCPVIFREIARIYPERQWPELTLLDAFMGGGAVSLYAKAQGFRVLANDLAQRCYLVGKGIIENNSQKITNEDLGLLFAERNGHPRFVEQNYVPQTFSLEMARFLDQALANLRDAGLEETHEALLYAALIRAMLLTRTGGQMTNLAFSTNMSRGNFDAITQGQLKAGYCRAYFEPPPHKMRKVQRHVNGGIFAGNAQVFQEDALTWMPEQQADIAYLDPPYFGSTSYEATYHHLDCILAGRSLGQYRPSRFNRRESAWLSLVQMFEAADRIPTWVFSFADNPDGFSQRQLCDLIAEFDREPRVVPLQHRWSIATTEDQYMAGAKELLIIAR
jgi:adenine-specific DNA methylase